MGHFQNTNEVSYAILLVPGSRHATGYKLIVAAESQDSYRIALLDHNEKEGTEGMVISKALPGKYSEFEQTKSIRLRLDSIYVEWIEQGAVLYYWAGNRWRTLQTSD